MPKKQTKKPSHFSFAHPTRHGKLHLKKVLFITLFGAFGMVLAGAITAQVLYNRFVWDRLSENASLKITLLIQSALEGLDELKSSPQKQADNTLAIPEARLVFPAESDQVRNVLYYYQPASSDTDGSGYTWNTPESLQITTRQLSTLTRNKLMTGMTVEDVFELVPEAQACNRGFKLQFGMEEEIGLKLSGQKQLGDGRILYVYREPGCRYYTEVVDALEAYLLKAESY